MVTENILPYNISREIIKHILNKNYKAITLIFYNENSLRETIFLNYKFDNESWILCNYNIYLNLFKSEERSQYRFDIICNGGISTWSAIEINKCICNKNYDYVFRKTLQKDILYAYLLFKVIKKNLKNLKKLHF